MIVSAEFKNFRALRDLKIDLEPFTVIVGPNSCGKSTILEGLKLLSGTVRFNDSVLKDNISKGSLEDIQITCHSIDQQGQIFDYQIREYKLFDLLGKMYINEPYSNYINKFMMGAIMLNPNAKAMAEASYGASVNPTINSDGRGLATVCANLQFEYPEVFNKIQIQIKRVIKSLKLFRIRRARTKNYIGDTNHDNKLVFGEELLFDFENASGISANFVSEGTLITLCILVAATRADNEPFLVLIDDLERGLHPMATRELIQVLRDLQTVNPNLQIVATTHSPYLLDAFDPKEVRVAALDPQRGTVVACLDQAPDFEKWNAVLETGGVWSYVGEKWVLEQNQTRDIVENPS
jgi:AAA15 family ATPase/GTPase